MSDTTQDHATGIHDVPNLTIRVDPGTLVRTPDGRVWCRQEPEIGGWEIVPPGVVEALAEARSSRDTLYQCVLDISDEAFLCGVSSDTSDRIREIEQRAKAIMGDAPLTTVPQISVTYTCCKAQEYWPLTVNRELEMEHSELGATCGAYTGTYQDRMDDLRRERELLIRTSWLALQVISKVTTKRESDPEYFTGVEELYEAVQACEEAGLLPPDLPEPRQS